MIVDRDQQTLLLNADLMGEHQAIVHYLSHAWTVVHQFGGSIEAIARDEMRHFKWLAHAIVALGGVPDLSAPDLQPVFSGLEALDYDIDAEEEAISQYHTHQRDIADERIKGLLGRIVVDEEDHRRQFIAMRASWHEEEAQFMGYADAGSAGDRLQTLVSTEYSRILQYLMQSFLAGHVREVGLNQEDRAIDEMKHMSWVGEALADLGVVPQLVPRQAGSEISAGELYGAMQTWANEHMPGLVPIVERIIAHEEYQRATRYQSPWTVGSAAQGGWH